MHRIEREKNLVGHWGEGLLDLRAWTDAAVPGAFWPADSMKPKLFFADEKVRESFAALKVSRRTEDQNLATLLDQAFEVRSRGIM